MSDTHVDTMILVASFLSGIIAVTLGWWAGSNTARTQSEFKILEFGPVFRSFFLLAPIFFAALCYLTAKSLLAEIASGWSIDAVGYSAGIVLWVTMLSLSGYALYKAVFEQIRFNEHEVVVIRFPKDRSIYAQWTDVIAYGRNNLLQYEWFKIKDGRKVSYSEAMRGHKEFQSHLTSFAQGAVK